jgi:tetratricopeptide (TPR) repeat protein
MMELMLLVAIIAEMVYRSKFKYSATIVTLFAALSSVLGIVLIEYLTFTPVGSQTVEGVQSRYLIPPAIAGSIGLPRLIRWDRGYRMGTAVVVLCQLLTFFYMPMAVIKRYYLMADQPNFIRERLYFADALQAQGKFYAAAQEYHQVVAIQPDNYNAHNGLGNVFDAQGATQDALNEFQLSLAIKPDQAIAHSKMGRILGEMHKFPESVEELTLALRYDPANAYAHNDLGVALYQMGDYEKAAEQFGEALRLDSSFAGARQNLDLVQAKLKNNKVQNGRK